jgi:hypothetical protein
MGRKFSFLVTKMSSQNLLADGRLRRHKTSEKEVRDLLRVVERDLKDAEITQLSADRRFVTAYNAALQLATIALHCAGYRTSGTAHHFVTFHVLPEIMGKDISNLSDYFESCRIKRNVTDYDRAGEISKCEAEELLEEVRGFRDKMMIWVKAQYPTLLV